MKIVVSDIIAKGNRDLNSIGVRMESSDWYDYITRAIRKLRKGRTLPWQKREIDINFYSDVFKYALPSDFESFIKPGLPILTGYDESQDLPYSREDEFYSDSSKKLALSWERDSVYLLARITGDSDLEFDKFDGAASNYTLGGDGSSGQLDNTNFREGSGSLRFNITDVTNQTTITRTLTSTVDISDYVNLGYVFSQMYMPTAISSVSIRYGNDASNYYEISTVTTDFTGASYKTGWNVIGFDMQNAVETGSVDDDNIDYFQIIIDNTGVTDTNFRVDGLYFRLGTNYRLPYNSRNVVESASGSGIYQEAVTDGTNVILWEYAFQDLLQWKAAELAAMFKFRDQDLVEYCREAYNMDLIDFNNRFPSNEALISNSYYRQANKF